MERRTILKAFAAVAATCTCSRAFAQHASSGCSLSASAATSFAGRTKLTSSSGVALIDDTFPDERELLGRAFLVKPDFSFYDDSDGANAFATSANIFGDSAHGTVCFGVNLLKAEMGKLWWGAAVAGIAGHEWAHIVQAASGLSGPVWKRELHADFLAGWYLGGKAMAGTHVVIDGLGSSLFSKGSFDFNNPDWHGTPAQRVNSMIAGFNGAPTMLGIDAAYAQGRRFVGL